MEEVCSDVFLCSKIPFWFSTYTQCLILICLNYQILRNALKGARQSLTLKCSRKDIFSNFSLEYSKGVIIFGPLGLLRKCWALSTDFTGKLEAECEQQPYVVYVCTLSFFSSIPRCRKSLEIVSASQQSILFQVLRFCLKSPSFIFLKTFLKMPLSEYTFPLPVTLPSAKCTIHF